MRVLPKPLIFNLSTTTLTAMGREILPHPAFYVKINSQMGRTCPLHYPALSRINLPGIMMAEERK
jgi:hypothetical protein